MALIILVSLFIADFFITHQIIGLTGFEAEANPLMHWLLIATGTVWVLLFTKIVILLFLLFAVGLAYNFSSEMTQIRLAVALWGLVLLTSAVDLWSIHVLRVVS